MEILLNGESRRYAESLSIAELLRDAGFGERRVAVEVNREVVPKSRHGEHRLNDGDRVEIIQAIGGG